MERLTLEEAIVHAKEVADMNYNDAEKFDSNDSVENYMKANCMKCAEQHEKLAEWLEELKSYKEAEEQDLLVRLPCKVGDIVYDNFLGYLEWYEIKAISYGYCYSYVESNIKDEITFYCENYNASATMGFSMSAIGRTVFLTREEADQKLREMEHE